jgi:hypothetical protein
MGRDWLMEGNLQEGDGAFWFDAWLANGLFRRIFLAAASSGEGLLTEHRTAAQPWRRELVFVP